MTQSLETPELIDISPPVSARTPVWPGDVEFSRQVQMDFKTGGHMVLSSMTTTLHIGAHTDAPFHYHPDGQAMNERPLSRYYGKCQVVELELEPGARIEAGDFSDVQAPRVLFRTNSFPHSEWKDDFNSLSPGLIEALNKKGVVLVGIDTPSVDPMVNPEMDTHQALFRTDMAVLEGIDLSRVQPGLYKLIALPLKLEGCDASPVRAVLVR